jgi:DNA polymerase II small subunit
VDEGGRLIADDVIFPEIPTSREIGRAKRDVFAVFISDLHYGSREFLETGFDRFLEWLSGRDVDSSEKNLVGDVEYLLLAGDLCDGVGVYPDQKESLVVESIYDQYEFLAEKLKRLPQSIRMFCIPGNHDASRQALPRPPIPREFAEPLYRFGDRFWMLGDPCHLMIEGVGVLMTHGDSLDDLVTQIPDTHYTNPGAGMRELLRKRHLAPVYGGKTELAPLARDWLVIERVPDIVHFGHAHHNAFENYRGVQIINSGTFQGQTEFMRKQGVVPTPGVVTIVNLRTGEPTLKLFHDFTDDEIAQLNAQWGTGPRVRS